MSDERKEGLLTALDTLEIVYREASVVNPEPTLKAIQQIRQLLKQKPEIDEEYIRKKAQEIFLTSCYAIDIEKAKKIITQIINDTKGYKHDKIYGC